MHIGAVAMFTPAREVRSKQLVALIADRARLVPRLRRRITTGWWPPGSASWVDDPGFDRNRHVLAHELPPASELGIAGGQVRDPLLERVSAIMAEPLDLSRPPWQIHVITGLRGGQFAILVKLHHALADGLSAVEIGMRLLDGLPDGAPPRALRAVERPAADSRRTSLLDPLGLASGVIAAAPELARQAGQVLTIASTAVANLFRQGSSPLAAPSSAERDVALVRLDLPEVKRVRRHHGGTVNDLLLAVVSGALRDWLATRGEAVRDFPVRALIPVSRRHRAPNGVGNNQLSGYLCELPVGEPDARRRLRTIREQMDRNKAAGPHRGPGAIAMLAEQLPPAVHRTVTPLARSAATLLFDTVITSVPLPGLPMTLDGAQLGEVYPIVPLGPNQALGVALSTYRNTVHIGLQADREAVPDLRRLAEAIPRALWALAPDVSWPVAGAAAR